MHDALHAVAGSVPYSIIIDWHGIKKTARRFHGEYVITHATGQRFTSGRVYRQQIQSQLRNAIK